MDDQNQSRTTPSLLSNGAGLQYHKTVGTDAQALVDRRAGKLAQWNVHWQTPAIITVLFIAGIGGAFGHHFFYTHLNGRPAKEQLTMIRYGTALGFFIKSMLVGTVVLCYRQRIWHTIRTRTLTLSAIDGLFSATEDPAMFVNWEMMRNAKIATIMALASWLIPIASVLSPASLTPELRKTYNNTQSPITATLNFTHEAMFDYRQENEYAGSSLIYVNTTDPNGKKPGFFDYYDQPSKNAKPLTTISAYLQTPAVNTSPSWYKCEEVANSSQPKPTTQDSVLPFDLDLLAPAGDRTYHAEVDIGDYAWPQIDSANGMPVSPLPYPYTLGVFQSEPVLWIGYALKTNKPYDSNSPYATKWNVVHEPHILRCVLHHTRYTFHMNYTGTLQKYTRCAREFRTPVVNTTISYPDPKNKFDIRISPESNFVRLTENVSRYKLTAAYHAMGALLRNFLRGEIKFTNVFVTDSDISETKLINGQSSYVVDNLMDEIQTVFEEMLITLLSERHLVVADTASVACSKSRAVNVYVYHAQGLWIGHAFSVVAAFISILVGAYAIFQNGVSSDTQFSRIMVATRNPTIDRLSVGSCLGGDPFPEELRKTKLRFGVLMEDDPHEGPLGKVEHCCFGAQGEMKGIVKYNNCSGRQKWRRITNKDVGTIEEKERLLERDAGR